MPALSEATDRVVMVGLGIIEWTGCVELDETTVSSHSGASWSWRGETESTLEWRIVVSAPMMETTEKEITLKKLQFALDRLVKRVTQEEVHGFSYQPVAFNATYGAVVEMRLAGRYKFRSEQDLTRVMGGLARMKNQVMAGG